MQPDRTTHPTFTNPQHPTRIVNLAPSQQPLGLGQFAWFPHCMPGSHPMAFSNPGRSAYQTNSPNPNADFVGLNRILSCNRGNSE